MRQALRRHGDLLGGPGGETPRGRSRGRKSVSSTPQRGRDTAVPRPVSFIPRSSFFIFRFSLSPARSVNGPRKALSGQGPRVSPRPGVYA